MMYDCGDGDEFDEGIDLTPLLDVVFILIIFFAISTTFSKPVLDIILPGAENGVCIEKKEREISVVIDKEGSIFSSDRLCTRGDIEVLMKNDAEMPVNLYVDENAPFGSFLLILDIAKKEGRDNVYISTEKKEN